MKALPLIVTFLLSSVPRDQRTPTVVCFFWYTNQQDYCGLCVRGKAKDVLSLVEVLSRDRRGKERGPHVP